MRSEVERLEFQEIGRHLYDGIYITDGFGKTVYVNEAYSRITGIKSEDVVGKYVSDLIIQGYFKNAVTPEVLRCKRQVNAVAEITRTGKKLLITGIPIFDHQKIIKNVVVIDRDITDLLKMKEELEISQNKMKAVERDNNKNALEIEHLRKQYLESNFIGQKSRQIQQVVKAIHQVAPLDVTVLITGETGVGKEVVANEIYSHSSRKNGSFIKINCAAIPANLLEAELFGYNKGAFTGASSSGRVGMFELSDKGTLLLDEIGEMSLELQAKLLRVIQHKEVTRIGANKPVKLDVRILASTNRDLRSLVKQGLFREDLYYRLNVFPIKIPPLRERVEDIKVVVGYFLRQYSQKYGKQIVISNEGLILFELYEWPGNIRELQNILERLVIISEDGCIISKEQVGLLLNINPELSGIKSEGLGLKTIVENIERITIRRVLALYGSTRKAANVLQIDQSTLVKKAKRLGIAIKDEKAHQI